MPLRVRCLPWALRPAGSLSPLDTQAGSSSYLNTQASSSSSLWVHRPPWTLRPVRRSPWACHSCAADLHTRWWICSKDANLSSSYSVYKLTPIYHILAERLRVITESPEKAYFYHTRPETNVHDSLIIIVVSIFTPNIPIAFQKNLALEDVFLCLNFARTSVFELFIIMILNQYTK